MNNTQPMRIMPLLITALIVIVIAGIVLAAIGADATGTIAVLAGLSVALATIGVVLVRVASTPIVKIQSILLERQKEANHFEIAMAEKGLIRKDGPYKPIRQIAAPQETVEQNQVETDPRHGLLVSLCLLTIRTDKCGQNQYGPTSKRLMTADDAQTMSKGGGKFADRKNWNDASKYGQEQHYIWEKRGGVEQGMMVDDQKCGGATVADLINKLMEHNTALRAGIDALPALNR